jgi:hypothetical protein
VKTDEQKPAAASAEGADARLEQVGRGVVVELSLLARHRVLEALCTPPNEGPAHELLRFAAAGSAGRPPRCGSEAHALGPWRTCGHRRRTRACGPWPGSEQRVGEQCLHPSSDASVLGVGLVGAASAKPSMNSGEDLVCLVDDAEIERRNSAQSACARFAAGEVAGDEEDARATSRPTSASYAFAVMGESVKSSCRH